ncbi:MAG: AIR synthase-related protein [Chloroflexota bacterium]|nr:AIR synthase-related protein [Chloroflexota bacterium]
MTRADVSIVGDDVNVPELPLKSGKLPGPLLDRLVSTYRTRTDRSVLVPPGYGRDAAALQLDSGVQLIVKSDPITFVTEAAAQYLIAVNANDIACLGGVPRWLSVVALLPEKSTTEALVEQLFAELRQGCDASGISIIGGHTEITIGVDRPLLIGTMLGIPGPRGILEPGGGKEGDDVLISKWIGIEGTALVARERKSDLQSTVSEAILTRAAKLLRHPGISIVEDARAALAVPGITALHDPTEGGIATAIHELGRGSQCGAEILADAIPILPETRVLCDQLELDPLGLLSSGALLMSVSPDRRGPVEAECRRAGIPVTHIGRLVSMDEGFTMILDGKRQPLPRFDTDEVSRVLQRSNDTPVVKEKS